MSSTDATGTPSVSKPDGWPSVSVIVPVHGDRGELAKTAKALAAQDYRGDIEVIVVDNGDNRDLSNSLRSLRAVSIIREERPGSYAARNAGVRTSTGDVLAFTDGDCLPRGDWLRQGVSVLRDHGAGAFVGGQISLFAADPLRPRLAELWDCANGLRQDHYVADQGWAATANMMTWRTTFNEVGFFDERLQSGGDREWGTRSARHQVTAIFSESAAVDHPARPTMAELHKKVRRVTRGDVDARRTRHQGAFDKGTTWVSLRPHTRSIVERSRALAVVRGADRLRYVLVAHWIQYYFLWARASYAVRGRINTRTRRDGRVAR